MAELAGRLRHAGERPAVGDWVAFRDARIHAVLPRTKLSRKQPWLETKEQVLAANVDIVFLVSALDRDLNLRRLERYLTMAWESGADPVLVVSKADLCAEAPERVWAAESVTLGVPVHPISSVSGRGLDELARYFKGNRTVALLGSSGVGKSTLINTLTGRDLLRVQELRKRGKGRHTTTHRELVLLPGGGLVLDTPGLRELQLWDGAEGLGSTFEDIALLASECRFRDCRHEREPGCAVLHALEDGSLAAGRLQSYRKLQRELHALELRQDKRAAAEERRKHRAQARSMRRT